MSSNVPLCPARSAPLSPPQSALDLVEEVMEEEEDQEAMEEVTVEDQDQEDTVEEDQGAMAPPPGGRGGLLTLLVSLDMPGVEDAAEEDHHQVMEDQAMATEDQEDTEVMRQGSLY